MRGLLLCLALAFILLPRTAAATSLLMDYQKFAPASSNTSVAFLPTGATEWVTRTVRAGETRWALNPAVPSRLVEYDSSFYSYCLDLLNHEVDDDNVAVKATNLLTVSGVREADAKAAWLFNDYASTVQSMPGSHSARALAAAESSAGLQVAIWDALLDSRNDLLNATFTVNSNGNIRANAMNFLTGIYAGGPWLDAEEAQGQVYLPGVPEPGTLILLSAGLACTIVLRRRRRTR